MWNPIIIRDSKGSLKNRIRLISYSCRARVNLLICSFFDYLCLLVMYLRTADVEHVVSQRLEFLGKEENQEKTC